MRCRPFIRFWFGGRFHRIFLLSQLSSEHYVGSPHSYGLAHTPERFRQDWLSAHTPISGLYLTGHDLVSCGVMGATIAVRPLRNSPLLVIGGSTLTDCLWSQGFLTAIAIKPQIAWHNLRILTNL